MLMPGTDSEARLSATPSTADLEMMVEGAREHGLEEDHLRELEALRASIWTTGEPS